MLVLAFNTYLSGKKFHDFSIRTFNVNDPIEVGRMILESHRNFQSLDSIVDDDLLAINERATIEYKNSKKKSIKTNEVLSFNETKPMYVRPVYVYTAKYRKLLEKIIISKSDTEKYILCSAIKPISNDNLVYVSFVTNQCGAKSYTMRSRQFYRSGVLFCLTLTLITVITPYYLFYGLSFIFSY